MKETIRFWYKTEGCCTINRQLLELYGKNIGQIPLVNLLPEEFKDEQNDLLELLVKDGAKVEEVLYSDNSKELFIII